jgi:hypothetical protein
MSSSSNVVADALVEACAVPLELLGNAFRRKLLVGGIIRVRHGVLISIGRATLRGLLVS